MICPRCGCLMYSIKGIYHCPDCGWYGNPNYKTTYSDNTKIDTV